MYALLVGPFHPMVFWRCSTMSHGENLALMGLETVLPLQCVLNWGTLVCTLFKKHSECT